MCIRDSAWAIGFPRWPIFKLVSFLQYLVFFRADFCTEQLYCACRMVFRMFFAFLIFDPNWPFCKGYSLCEMADFHFNSFQWFFACFWHFLFLTQIDNFAKGIIFASAIAFARWPIFKIVSFLQYLVFFRAVFCTEQLYCSCRMVFCMFLAYFNFWSKLTIFQGI